MTSYPSQSSKLHTLSVHPTPCVPSTAIVLILCVVTVISCLRVCALFFVSLCRRRCRPALPRRLRLRATNFLLFVIYSLIPLSLSPFLPCYLVSQREFSRPAARRVTYLSFSERIWCFITTHLLPLAFHGSTPVLVYRLYEQSHLWIQLA